MIELLFTSQGGQQVVCEVGRWFVRLKGCFFGSAGCL